MAYLVDPDGRLIYLSGLHTIGRLPQGMDTIISQPEISRYHAAIEWSGNVWWVKDLSMNGTWVNGRKLTKNTPHQLEIKDQIQFGDAKNTPFIVSDISSPEDILLCNDEEQKNDQRIIHLNTYHLLPNEQSPEIAIYCKSGRWILEELGNHEAFVQILQNKDSIRFSCQQWQVHLANDQTATLPLQTTLSVDDATLIFNLSLDEETTQISILTLEKVHNLSIRSHHYMTLMLARQLIEDIHHRIDKTEQGWIYAEVLAKRLGIEESHLNIQIHRARKQFSELFGQHDNAEQLIQRRSGQVRLNCQHFKIYKGDNLESSSTEYLTHNASTA